MASDLILRAEAHSPGVSQYRQSSGSMDPAIDSSIRSKTERFFHCTSSISSESSMSWRNIRFILRAKSELRTTALTSLLRAMLHQSRFDDPTVDQTSSIVAVLA